MTKLTKLEMRRKRLEILSEIDRLEKDRCDFCIDEALSKNNNKSNCDCPASVEVLKLGNQLLKLVSSRKTTDLEDIKAPNMQHVTIKDLTVDLYKKMKLAKMRDVDIYRKAKVGSDTFYRWKTENGLTKKKETKR